MGMVKTVRVTLIWDCQSWKVRYNSVRMDHSVLHPLPYNVTMGHCVTFYRLYPLPYSMTTYPSQFITVTPITI